MKNIALPRFEFPERCNRIIAAVCLFGAMLAGCTSPEAKHPRDSGLRSSVAEPSGAAGPRLGLLLAHKGNWRGQQIIPAAWIEEATSVRQDQPHLQPGTRTFLRSYGYGYQVWIFSGERRMFMLLGVCGQVIVVDPAGQLVMVHTAVRRESRDPGHAEAVALWRSLVQQLGN